MVLPKYGLSKRTQDTIHQISSNKENPHQAKSILKHRIKTSLKRFASSPYLFIPNKIKIRLFTATVESVLLYGCSTWTLTKAMEKSLDGTYTRMLRMALNVSWKEHKTNIDLYGNLPKLSSKIAERRCKLAGHCVRHPEEEASKTILWEPTEGTVNRGRKVTNYIDVLKRDTGLTNTNELRTAMMDRDIWRGLISKGRTGVRPK